MSSKLATIRDEVSKLKSEISELKDSKERVSKELVALKNKRDSYKGCTSPLARERRSEYNKFIDEQNAKLAECKMELSAKTQRLKEAKEELTALEEPTAFVEGQIEELVSEFRKWAKKNEVYLSKKVPLAFEVYAEKHRFVIGIVYDKKVVNGDWWPEALSKQITYKTQKRWREGWDFYDRGGWEYYEVAKFSAKLLETIRQVRNEVIRKLVIAFKNDENFKCEAKENDSKFVIKLR